MWRWVLREKRIRVFLCGDYEFLCRIFGISGASGRHCCLWCTIASGNLKVPLLQRGLSTPRTLESLKADHGRFMSSGGDMKKAKQFNNVVNAPLFDIPLDQVCLPGLHISLGIFGRLFHLLEQSCHELDLGLAETTQQEGSGFFAHYCAALHNRQELKEKRDRRATQASTLEQLVGLLALTLPGADTNPILSSLRQQATEHRRVCQQLERDIAQSEGTVGRRFNVEDGPFVKALDKALKSFHVDRQPYFGGTFIGNHVHLCLKEHNIETLCSAVTAMAAQSCPALVVSASEVYSKFKAVLTLFAQCHTIYDASMVSTQDISNLGDNIIAFMAFYRETFPKATILLKMHMLEDHVVPWLRKWRVGFGLMGEQGAESIHASFNSMKVQSRYTYSKVEQLRRLMTEHFLRVQPANRTLLPKIKRRKTN